MLGFRLPFSSDGSSLDALGPRRVASVFRSQCLWLSFSLGLISAVGCGARSELRGAEPCPRDGEVLECVGVCGEGITTCIDGFWSPCDIPPRDEECIDICGTGLRHCEEEQWGRCIVPPTSASCENDCGTGIRTCESRVWSECQVEPLTQICSFGCGDGEETCADNEWGPCDATRPLPPILTATIRDFLDTHPDFEPLNEGPELGIVADRLDAEGKPVYAGGSFGTHTTTGPEYFDQWYRDVPAVNQATTIELQLRESPRMEDFYVYEDHTFFPIDGELLGNQNRSHNYHFTLEGVATFYYREGQVFRFIGDDDVWVFINGHLVIDLGGTHQELEAEVDLDDVADEIGIEPDNEYSLHIFFAERHTIDSNFTIETSIANLGQCPAE